MNEFFNKHKIFIIWVAATLASLILFTKKIVINIDDRDHSTFIEGGCRNARATGRECTKPMGN